MARNRTDPCQFCNGPMRPGQVTVDLRRGRELVVVEGVPARVCERCGHRYYHADVVRKMETILALRRKPGRTVKVPVVKFDAVA